MDLPNGWAEVNMPEVVEWSSGGTPKADRMDYYGGDIPWLIIGDLTDGVVVNSEKRISELGLQASSAKFVEVGSVLLAMYGSIGKLGIAGVRLTTNQAIAFTRSMFGLSNRFLFYYLAFRKGDLLSLGKGGTQKNISLTVINGLRLNLPPLGEQHRIVEKIDVLFSELDKGVEYLQTVKRQLQTYRQAVLKWAFEGTLTETWRKNGRVESSSSVKDKIFSARKVETNRSTYESVNPEFELYQLPSQWQWVSIGAISKGVEYGTAVKSQKQGDVAVLRMGNIQNHTFIYDDLVYTSDNDEIEKYRLFPGDVLFNRTNSAELVGKTAIYTGILPAIFAGYLIRLNQISYVNPKYLNYYLNSPHAKQCGNKVKTDGVNQSNINGTKLSSYPFPLCSAKEQAAVAAEIESRLSVCDALGRLVEDSLHKINSLRQSILREAFEGRLVPQDPNNEPAEKSLERIKTERSAQDAKTKRRRANA